MLCEWILVSQRGRPPTLIEDKEWPTTSGRMNRWEVGGVPEYGGDDRSCHSVQEPGTLSRSAMAAVASRTSPLK